MIGLRLCILGSNDTEYCALVSVSSRGYVISKCLITSAANFDHMVKMVYVRFLYYKIIIFVFVIDILLGGTL